MIKFSERDKNIFRDYLEGRPQKYLAIEYEISKVRISQIIRKIFRCNHSKIFEKSFILVTFKDGSQLYCFSAVKAKNQLLAEKRQQVVLTAKVC